MNEENPILAPVWQWKSDLNSLDFIESAWSNYSNKNNHIIEESYIKEEKKIEIKINNQEYIIDFEMEIQYLKSDEFRQRKIRRFFKSKYIWYWKSNYNPDNELIELWSPYDLNINNYIEEEFLKGNNLIKIAIRDKYYTLDLKNKIQYYENDISKIRQIERGLFSEIVTISRKNVYNKFESTHYYLKNYNKENNIQVRLKIKDLLHKTEYIEHNELFNTDICISSHLENYLKNNFNNDDYIIQDSLDVIKILIKEIKKEAKNLSTYKILGDRINSHDYKKHVEVYIQMLNDENNSLYENIIKMYSAEGFLRYSIEKEIDNPFSLFLVLLKSSLVINYINQIDRCKLLLGFNNYINLFKLSQITNDQFIEYKNNKSNFITFHENLSCTYVEPDYILDPNQYFIVYEIRINEEELKNNPTILSFVDNISLYKEEKEIIVSNCVFSIEEIIILDNKLKYIINFISNGFNHYDYISYSDSELQTIENTYISEIQAKNIGKSLNYNKKAEQIILSKNNLSDVELIAFCKSFKFNNVLLEVSIINNQIADEGIKIFADSINKIICLKELYLSGNRIGNIGVECLFIKLITNNTLEIISIAENLIDNKGANSIANSLKKMNKLKTIDISKNAIKNYEKVFNYIDWIKIIFNAY